MRVDQRKQLGWHARAEQWSLWPPLWLLAPAIQRGPWPWKQVGLPFWFSFLITWSVERGYWKQRPSCAHWQFKHNEDKEPQTQEGSGFNLRCLPSSFIIWKRASSNNGQRNNKMNGFPPSPPRSYFCHQTLNQSVKKRKPTRQREEVGVDSWLTVEFKGCRPVSLEQDLFLTGLPGLSQGEMLSGKEKLHSKKVQCLPRVEVSTHLFPFSLQPLSLPLSHNAKINSGVWSVLGAAHRSVWGATISGQWW